MGDELLTPSDLVARWDNAVTTGTLANWRSKGRGPRFIKLGKAVRYRLPDILEYERLS
jgi:hypothetical protein